MADIKIYGKLVANTEDQVVADASSIQDTARNQKLSVTLNELAQGTGLKVLEVNLNNYLSQDGLLALIQGINYATIGDAISYQFTSSIAVDSSYNAVHVTASVSGQGGIDLYLLKSINEKFSCETLVSDGYNSKYKTIQNATLITSSGYIRGIVVTNSLVGNLCDLVNGRSELTSTKLTYWFPVGVLPTHIKLANDIIIDLQGNEYCAIGSETIDAEISNRVYLNVVKIDINGDFSNVSANDIKVVDFLWHHIENPNNFSFDDLPRFSDSSDVADFPGSSGGDTPSQSGSSITRLTVGFGGIYKVFLNFVCSQSELYAQLNQYFGLMNSQMGTSLNTNCASTSDIVANLDILKQIDTTGGSSPDNNLLVLNALIMLGTWKKCMSINSVLGGEYDTDLNCIDILRYGYSKWFYIDMSGNITQYRIDSVIGDATITYEVAIENL